jgi:hypothetical protein
MLATSDGTPIESSLCFSPYESQRKPPFLLPPNLSSRYQPSLCHPLRHLSTYCDLSHLPSTLIAPLISEPQKRLCLLRDPFDLIRETVDASPVNSPKRPKAPRNAVDPSQELVRGHLFENRKEEQDEDGGEDATWFDSADEEQDQTMYAR